MAKITLCIISFLVSPLALSQSSAGNSVLKAHPPVVLENLVDGSNPEKSITHLQKVIKEVAPVARGTQVLTGKLFATYQSSLEKLKSLSGAKATDWLMDEGEMWFQLFERVSYEEGRFQSLVEVIAARELLWKALQDKLGQDPTLGPDFARWLEARKPSYPVDRIFLLEAKARWPQGLMKSAEKVTQYLQKQPELSLVVISKSIKLAPTKEVQSLEKEWADTQIQKMKSELGSYENLLKLAKQRSA